MRSSYSDILSEINIYKSKVKIEQSQLENFVRYLDQVVFKKYFFFCSPNKASVAPSFQRAFKTLSDYQRADYYLGCYKVICELKKSKVFVQQRYKETEQVEMQYRRQTQSKIWKKTCIIMNYDKVELQVTSLNLKLRLQNYILRRSNSKNKFAFVLQSTNAECEPVTLRLSHPNAIQLQSLLVKMRGLVNAGLKLKISRIIGLSRRSRQFVNDWYQMNQSKSVKIAKSDPQQQKSLRGMLKNKISIDFDIPYRNSQDTIPKYLVEQQLFHEIDNFQQFEEISKGIFYHLKRERVKKMVCFDSKQMSMQNLAKQIFKHEKFKSWKKSLYAISLIGDVSKENTKFYHEINIYKDCNEVDYVYLRHRFEQNDMIYFIDKSIATAEYGSHQNTNSRGKIEYCIWRIRKRSYDCVQLLVEIEITHIPCVDVYLAMSEQIGELENILLSKQIVTAIKRRVSPTNFSFLSMDEGNVSVSMQILNELESFQGIQMKTPVQQFDGNDESQFYSIVDYQHEQEIQNTNINQELAKITEKNIKSVYRYHLFPRQTQQKNYKQFKEGVFFNSEECVVNDIGDLVFTNQQKIKAQSSIIKSVLKRIGANFFTGKSILNVSLPIQIFAADTNLQRLCRGMAYGPLFLENKEKATPLQKMKAVICFAIGNLLLYIDMAKPFNPILGETYQTFIDGCPVYGEQISHHPPISSLLMIGRGYQVSAKIQAKVQLGLNSANGLNDGCYQVVFEKQKNSKSGIVFTSPPGELGGVIYGERKLNIIQKSQYFDYQNKLYCQITWGKNKSSNTVGRYHDYLQGKIIQLNRASSNIAKIKQSDKDIVLGHITGRWTEVVYFNGEPIFEINKVKPFKPIEESRPLLSDSFFREDRRLVEQGKFVEAQNAKQKWQQVQRRDRKLRKQNQ